MAAPALNQVLGPPVMALRGGYLLLLQAFAQ